MVKALLVILLMGIMPLSGQEDYLYRLKIIPGKGIRVSLVLPPGFDPVFLLGDERGRERMDGLMLRGRDGRARYPLVAGDRMELGDAQPGDTLSYFFHITRSEKKIRGLGYRRGMLQLSLPLMLWRPALTGRGQATWLEVEAPPGWEHSFPGRRRGNRYRLNPLSHDWPSAAVVGPLRQQELSVMGIRFRLSGPESISTTDMEKLSRWIEDNVRSVAGLYGSLPQKEVQILFVPTSAAQPVPFALVLRGGGATIRFYINPRFSLEKFMADWTAPHEISHLLLPFVRRGDAWFSEGLATYYQYILMARDGRLSEQEAWQRIYAGFEKGRRGREEGKSLAVTSREMGRRRAYSTVYWSGAAFFLRLDVALRSSGISPGGLDDAVGSLAPLLASQRDVYTCTDLIDYLDEHFDTAVFSRLYRRFVLSGTFPVDEAFLKSLGVGIRDGRVVLNDRAPLASIRRTIMKAAKPKF